MSDTQHTKECSDARFRAWALSQPPLPSCGCPQAAPADQPAYHEALAQLAADDAARAALEASPTPVSDALQAVDQAGTEYGVPSAELMALRKLAGAVRSHGIGADLGARRLPDELRVNGVTYVRAPF